MNRKAALTQGLRVMRQSSEWSEGLEHRRESGGSFREIQVGKVYTITREDPRLRMWDVVTDYGERYLFPKSYFRLIDE